MKTKYCFRVIAFYVLVPVLCVLFSVRGTLTSSATTTNATGNATTATVKQVSAGGAHTCVLTSSGGVKCWGYNGDGQLGNGSTTDSSTPVDVLWLTSRVSAVSAGWNHTCALLTTGVVKCWGLNEKGQLGNGSSSGPEKCLGYEVPVACSTKPVNVSGLNSSVASIFAGGDHTCVLLTTGAVKCWGENGSGQIGNGTGSGGLGSQYCNDMQGPVACFTIPVNVTGLSSGVSSISTGYAHTCVLLTTGTVKCWGDNRDGQLGNGTSTGPQTCKFFACSSVPVTVSGLSSGVTSISAGGWHTCAVLTTGAVKCWGFNDTGQLGTGTKSGQQTCIDDSVCSTTPVNASGLSNNVASVSLGESHTCALLTTGAVQCWGYNYNGELGIGTSSGPENCKYDAACSTTPVDVSGLSGSVSSISAGDHHTCALLTAGTVKCWGYNDVGRLGNGTNPDDQPYSAIPVDVSF